MSKITDYSFLFQSMFGTSKLNPIGSFRLSQLNSGSVQAQLRAAGIDTNSRQYKAAMKEMMQAGNGAMYTNIQCIKNSMKCYDKDGDFINPRNGLAGLVLTDENAGRQKRIISISESSKDEMFELAKKEFLRENGVLNGDTTRRRDVYDNLYRKTKKDDRLAAGYTMEQYERAYRQAFLDAARKADPKWEIGKPVPSGALYNVTKESAESQLAKGGNTLVKRSSVSGKLMDLQI